MARTDTLSILLETHDNYIDYLQGRIALAKTTITAVIADPDYAANTSAGEKTIITDNQTALTVAAAALLTVLP